MFVVKKHESSNKTIRMRNELIEKLKKIANEKRVSLNQLIVQCCEYAIEHLSENDDKSNKDEW